MHEHDHITLIRHVDTNVHQGKINLKMHTRTHIYESHSREQDERGRGVMVFQFLGSCRVCRRWPTALLGVFGRGVVRACACWACLGYKPAVPVSVVVVPPVSLSPGARYLRACPRDRLLPLPGTPILGSLLMEFSGLRACSS
ncbi:hypothetical protein Taro_049881, partial [Colocasia esculenta]|nr:hypothetical protein [Colocasia esculenta]